MGKRASKNRLEIKIIKKITFEFTDGSKIIFENKKAEKFKEIMQRNALFYWSHFGETGFEDIDWEEN